jgi:hypothetical protein
MHYVEGQHNDEASEHNVPVRDAKYLITGKESIKNIIKSI